jgi:hypothetical protein
MLAMRTPAGVLTTPVQQAGPRNRVRLWSYGRSVANVYVPIIIDHADRHQTHKQNEDALSLAPAAKSSPDSADIYAVQGTVSWGE